MRATAISQIGSSIAPMNPSGPSGASTPTTTDAMASHLGRRAPPGPRRSRVAARLSPPAAATRHPIISEVLARRDDSRHRMDRTVSGPTHSSLWKASDEIHHPHSAHCTPGLGRGSCRLRRRIAVDTSRSPGGTSADRPRSAPGRPAQPCCEQGGRLVRVPELRRPDPPDRARPSDQGGGLGPRGGAGRSVPPRPHPDLRRHRRVDPHLARSSVKTIRDGEIQRIGNLGRAETNRNPDADVEYGFVGLDQACADQIDTSTFGPVVHTGVIESHPYATAKIGGTTYVADAASNVIW